MKYNSKAQKNKIKATQLEIFIDHVSTICDLYLNVIIDPPQKISLRRLIQAMSLVAAQEPRISARYIREGNRSYWEFEKNPDWDIEEIFSSDEITEYAPELIANPPHPEGNFPISIRLIHFPGRDRLHVRINHILTDGGGTKEFIYTLASAYRKIIINPDINSDTSDWKNRQFIGLRKWLKTFPIGLVAAGLISDKKSLLLPADYFAVPMKICKTTEGRIVLLHLNSHRVFRLKNFARIKKATINDILLTAFSRALSNCFASRTNFGKQIGVIVTSDLRKYIDWERSLCNLSNARVLKLGTLPLRGHIELLEDVIRLTIRWKKNLTGLGNFLFNKVFLKCLSGRSIRFLVNKLSRRDQHAKVCRIVLTNFGLLDPTKIDFGDGPCSNAFILPAIGTPPFLVAGASGCADKICFSIGYRTGSLSADTMNKLIKEFDNELYLLE
jgi:NRPS condensation-like uncharacterized protein